MAEEFGKCLCQGGLELLTTPRVPTVSEAAWKAHNSDKRMSFLCCLPLLNRALIPNFFVPPRRAREKSGSNTKTPRTIT